LRVVGVLDGRQWTNPRAHMLHAQRWTLAPGAYTVVPESNMVRFCQGRSMVEPFPVPGSGAADADFHGCDTGLDRRCVDGQHVIGSSDDAGAWW
jgi:hypothetical protein